MLVMHHLPHALPNDGLLILGAHLILFFLKKGVKASIAAKYASIAVNYAPIATKDASIAVNYAPIAVKDASMR